MLVGVSVLSVGIGFAAASLIKSPAQLAAESDPPPRSDITASVETGTITKSTLLSGVVTLGNIVEIAPELPPNLAPVVTRVPTGIGSVVGPGTVLLEVADRPVILLPGDVPLLRDLTVGASGTDVLRLQDALRATGREVRDKAGYFGQSTSKALADLYTATGHRAPKDEAGQMTARRSELVFAPNGASGRVVDVSATLGRAVENPVITLTTAPAIVSAELAPYELSGLSVGDRVSISGEGTVGGEGSIASIGAVVKGEDGGLHAPLTVVPDVPLLPESIGEQLQITVHADDEQEEGLLVPLSAIHSDADGETAVIVIRDGTRERVSVTVLETGDGRARVSAPDTRLIAGDLVLIGQS